MGTVTLLVGRLAAGSRSALAGLGRRFHSRQRRLAARLLGPAYPGLNGPDDIANQVLHRLAREAVAGTPAAVRMTDTRSLLATLDLLTAQRVQKAREYDRRAKRDVRRTVRQADRPADAPFDWPAAEPYAEVDWPGGLTDRQREIGRRVAAGWGYGEIAAALNLSVRTVTREVAALRDAFAGRQTAHF